jgi:hypothetical protein
LGQIRKIKGVKLMADLLIELPADVYNKLKNKANNLGKSPQELVQEFVISQFDEPQETALSEREKGRQALLAGGLLTELGPELKKRANQNTISLEEAQQILGNAGGRSLSEIVIEQRELNF